VKDNRRTKRAGVRRCAVTLAALAAGTAAFTGAAQAVTTPEFSLDGPVSALTAGPDGSAWFSDPYDGVIGRVTPAGGLFQYQVYGYDLALTIGSDGNVWAANEFGGVERITPDGAVTDFPGEGDVAWNITTGSDGNVWYSSSFSNAIGRVTPAGQITRFPLPEGTSPGQIVQGPDGNLWFLEASGQIGRIATDGTLLSPLPRQGSAPVSLAGGSDAVWFAEQAGNAVGRITANGTVTEFADLAPGDNPYWIAAGADGNAWFAAPGNDRIGRVTPDGSIDEYNLPADAAPTYIVASSDGAAWVADSANRIVRLVPDTSTRQPVINDVAATVNGTSRVVLNANVRAQGSRTSAYIEYGTTTAYGDTTQVDAVNTQVPAFFALIENLLPATTYHYRVVATNAEGTTRSPDYTFTTQAEWTPPTTASGR